MSVSIDVRRLALEEAGYKSVLSETRGRPLECCHLSHERNEYYNLPDVVVVCTDIEHLAYHLLFTNKSEEIGMRYEHHNDYAIRSLYSRILAFNKKRGVEMEVYDQIEKAKNYWFYYLGIEG
jgi:hypothetical protein